MQFLNDWRCRIPEKNFSILKERLQQWATLWIPQLPDASRAIRSLNESERAQIGASYQPCTHFALIRYPSGTLQSNDRILPAWGRPD